MYAKLMALTNRPVLDASGTAGLYRALWEDEHISKRMLESHLDPDSDGATGNHQFVFKSAQWIAELAPPPQFAKLLDLGCGPGIYAERFAKEGYSVTGVDFSKHSVRYAKEQTALNGCGIEYHYQNYLTIDYTEQFDAMTPVRRQRENRTWQYYDNGGFFSEKPHLLLEAVYQYGDGDKTELEQYIVVTHENVDCFLTRTRFFTRESLMAEVRPVGFSLSEFYDDIAGKKYSGAGETICGVFTK
ncbi:MAG: class I SAM-dependent methyltransferase [Oscillospiraceae bacterium]|jgi:hypothetical protein|nr:class I SAM-dependent methyltransferase [Oscillospiraceae bacterium]